MKPVRLSAMFLFSMAAIAGGQDRKDLPIHGDAPLPDVIDAWTKKAAAPPIQLTFELKTPGYVTLVIDDDKGRRVRNLVAETFYKAGTHSIAWDGLDDSAIPTHHPGTSEPHRRLVEPGKYVLRGLVRDQIDLRYEASVNTSGDPPWRSPDGKGGWLADHTPPADVVFLPGKTPQMLIGSFVAEAGDGLVWADLDGRRIKGRRSIGAGGGWWGAYLLARDDSPKEKGARVYLAGAWQKTLQVWSLEPNAGQVFSHSFDNDKKTGVEGLTARGGIVAVSLVKDDKLLLIDGKSGKILGKLALPDPRGLAFDKEGRLLVLSGKKLLRFAPPTVKGDSVTLGEPETLIADNLLDPRRLTLDADGNVYVSDWGTSHQVKVFTPKGEPLRTIGHAGGARLGPYDPERMDHPAGLAIAPNGNLWVAENSQAPRRVSIWSRDGKLLQSLIGSPQYGGGGGINPARPDRFLYGGPGNAGLEFSLDRAAGKGRLENIYYLGDGPGNVGLPGMPPQTGFVHQDRLYLTNAFNSSPTNGSAVIGIWTMRDGLAIPVAAGGVTAQWPKLAEPAFASRKHKTGNGLFAWSDLNGDGKVDPDEVTFSADLPDAGPLGSTYVTQDLKLVNANAALLSPTGFTKAGAPIYDAAKTQLLIKGLTAQTGSSGGGETILGRDGRLVVTGGPIRGFKNGLLDWTYPSHWPSLHGANWGDGHSMSRVSPPAPGLIVGATHLIGQTVTPPKSDAGELWAITGNVGSIYLLTTDGLFVATLFRDRRIPGAFGYFPRPVPGELLNDATPGEEHFYPSMTQAVDGKVYLQAMIAAGGTLTHSNVIRVDGLDTIKRLPPQPFEVSAAHLAAAYQGILAAEVRRIDANGRRIFEAPLRKAEPKVDGDLKEWTTAKWMALGEIPFHHQHRPVEASVLFANGRLFGAIRTAAHGALERIGTQETSPQKVLTSATAINVMLETDPEANPDRVKSARGDVRLVITRAKGKPLAMLFRPVDGSSRDPIPIRSSWREIFIDRVQDVSDKVTIVTSPTTCEFSVDLTALGFDPRPGTVVRADLGLQLSVPRLLDQTGLRPGNLFGADHGDHVVRRLNWHDKSSNFEPDRVGAAVLAPALWGRWRIAAPE